MLCCLASMHAVFLRVPGVHVCCVIGKLQSDGEQGLRAIDAEGLGKPLRRTPPLTSSPLLALPHPLLIVRVPAERKSHRCSRIHITALQ